jgi:hypothetical protein
MKFRRSIRSIVQAAWQLVNLRQTLNPQYTNVALMAAQLRRGYQWQDFCLRL